MSTFASFILITRFILKSMDKICHAQNSNQSAGCVDVELAQQAEQVENYSPLATRYPYIVNLAIMIRTRFFDGFGFP